MNRPFRRCCLSFCLASEEFADVRKESIITRRPGPGQERRAWRAPIVGPAMGDCSQVEVASAISARANGDPHPWEPEVCTHVQVKTDATRRRMVSREIEKLVFFFNTDTELGV